jgi:predicted transcriptional regulator of viral defense system
MTTHQDRLIEGLAVTQHGLFTHDDLRRLGATRGVTRQRLARGRWREIRPRVYVLLGAPDGWPTDIHAAVLAAGPDAFASHWSAAALHGIAGFSPDRLEITVRRGRTPEMPDVTVHQTRTLPDAHVKQVDGVAVTTVARTLFDLAGTVHPLRTARALDTCLNRDVVTPAAVWDVVGDLARRGRAGSALMRELLLARDEGEVAPASALEALLLKVLTDSGLPLPAREVDVGDADGWVGRVDFVYRDAKLVIEADSRLHHSSLTDFESDRTRDNRLMAAGWRVLRITWAMLVERPRQVAELVRTALRTAAA